MGNDFSKTVHAEYLPPSDLPEESLYLLVTKGPEMGKFYKLGESQVIGRSPEVDITLPDDSVSSRHCRLTVVGFGAFLEDLGSSNGTFVNDIRIDDPVPLRLDSSILMGRTQFRLVNRREDELTAEK